MVFGNNMGQVLNYLPVLIKISLSLNWKVLFISLHAKFCGGIAFWIIRNFGKSQKFMAKFIWHGNLRSSGFIITLKYKWRMLLSLLPQTSGNFHKF